MSSSTLYTDSDRELDSLQAGSLMQVVVRRCVPPILGVLNAVCVFLIAFSKMGVLIGLTSFMAAEKASAFHSDVVRLPMFAVAIIGSLVNIYVLWNANRLRSATSAQWRRRPLRPGKRARNAVVLVLSLFTIAAVGAEIWIHPFHF